VTGILGKMKNGFQSFLSYLNLFIRYKLIFKKSIYFEGTIEEKDYKHDLVKCDLLVAQVLFFLSEIKIYLNFSKMDPKKKKK
jgi:hypothetical protein